MRLAKQARNREPVVQLLPPDPEAAFDDREVGLLFGGCVIEPRMPRRGDADVPPIGQGHAKALTVDDGVGGAGSPVK